MMTEEEKSYKDVLEKSYSPESSEDEKNAIYEMVHRLKRRLNWNVAEDHRLLDKERGPEIVQDLRTYLNNWKSLNVPAYNMIETDDFERVAIYAMSQLFIFYWIRDTDVVADILRQVYDYDGNFSTMFRHIMYGRTSLWAAENQEMRQKAYLTMLFYLNHAHRAKLEFSGVRFVDMPGMASPPIYMATFYVKPEMMLLLLQHGATLVWRLADGQIYDFHLRLSLRSLLQKLRVSLGTETQETSWDTSVLRSSSTEVCLCLRIVLRCVRQIPIGWLEFTFLEVEPGSFDVTSYRISHDFIRSLSERDVVPTLGSRYFEPSELRHLCRLTIRDALNKNWNLPYGVFRLPLPKVLQRYINLLED